MTGAGWVRVERLAGVAAPPHPAFGHLLPRWGEGTGRCHLSRALGRRDRTLSPLPRVGGKEKEGFTSPVAGRGRSDPARGSRAGEGERLAGVAAPPSSGLRPPSPALGRRDRTLSPLPRVGGKEKEGVTSPVAGRGRSDPARGSRAGEGERLAGVAAPLIRPSATFSRVGEKGQDVVTSPATGEKAQEGVTFSHVGEKRQDVVTSPVAGRGRSDPACGSRAGEG